MINIVGCIVDGHDLWLVGVAGLVCVLAASTSFNLLHRAAAGEGRVRYPWLVAAAVVMGSGVWVTHFIAMLAYKTPWPIGYNVPETILSAIVAMALSALGLWLALKGARSLGGVIAGMAIATMHYAGMAALEGAFRIDWDWSYVVASLAIGLLLPALAFNLLPHAHNVRYRALVVGLYVLAICGLHFTAMTAATLSFDPLGHPARSLAASRPALYAFTTATPYSRAASSSQRQR